MLGKVKRICTALTFLIPMLIRNPYVFSSSARLTIERGDQDVFDNPNCKSPTEISRCNCNGSNSDSCVNSTCKRCKCSSTYKTFLSSNDTNGQCVKDRHLLFIGSNYVPSFSNFFLVQNKVCMRPQWSKNDSTYLLRKIICSVADSWQRWIWTQYNQLMHVETLKCLQQGHDAFTSNGSKYIYLVLAECNSTETKQHWQCQGQTIVNLWLKTTKVYMYQGDWFIYGTDGNFSSEKIKWKRFPSGKTLCSEVTAFPNSFSVRNINKMCMRPQWNKNDSTYLVRKINCSVVDSWQRWIWTGYNQLMHVETLKCLQQGHDAFTSKGSKYIYLVLAECNSTETKQHWQCQGQTMVNLWPLKATKVYMYQGSWYIYGTDGNPINEKIKWKRFPSGKTLCSEAFGCCEFVQNSSAILVTNVKKCNQQCLEEREIAIPHKSGENVCFVMWDKLRYLDTGKWRQLSFRDEIFTIDKRNTRTFLKLNFRKATNNWAGLIVKLNFYCAERRLDQSNINWVKDIKCVVVKFKETVIYSTIAPSTVNTTGVVETTLIRNSPISTVALLNTTKVTEITNLFETSPTSTTTGAMSNTTIVAETYKSNSSPVTIIVVCVVIGILILCGILGFIYYKRRRRSVVRKESDSPADTQPFEATMNPTYSTLDNKPTPFFSGNEDTYQEAQPGASRECDLYEPADNHVYDSAGVKLNGKCPPLQEHAYDYAKSDDVRPVALRLLHENDSGDISRSPVESKGKDSHGNDKISHKQSPVYETLEDPSEDK